MVFPNVLAVSLIADQTFDVDAILDKPGDYVAIYEKTFVGLVAEETYRQEAASARSRCSPGPSRRRPRSKSARSRHRSEEK